MIEVVLPLRLVSEANGRECWQARWRRSRQQRSAARLIVGAALRRVARPVCGAIEIAITRHGPRPMDDDNLAAACKAVRDGIADALGVDDGDPRVRWVYAQRRGRQYQVSVAITITGIG